MKVRVLRPAFDDLAEGRGFYDRQEAGVGDYFFDSLFDLVYKYSKDGEFISAQGKELPKGWHLVFSNNLGRRITVVTYDKDVFIFSLVDPFDSTTMPLSKAEKELLTSEPKRP